jgi:hypothetical protein
MCRIRQFSVRNAFSCKAAQCRRRRDGVDWNAVLAGSAAPQPAQALDQTIQEAYEAQSVALQATPAELYH